MRNSITNVGVCPTANFLAAIAGEMYTVTPPTASSNRNHGNPSEKVCRTSETEKSA